MDQLEFLDPEYLPMTPVRRQYLDVKARHLDAILFFRLGDFYLPGDRLGVRMLRGAGHR